MCHSHMYHVVTKETGRERERESGQYVQTENIMEEEQREKERERECEREYIVICLFQTVDHLHYNVTSEARKMADALSYLNNCL